MKRYIYVVLLLSIMAFALIGCKETKTEQNLPAEEEQTRSESNLKQEVLKKTEIKPRIEPEIEPKIEPETELEMEVESEILPSPIPEEEEVQINLDHLGYSNNREDFYSDEAFANFRELQGGELATGKFYRSVSPIFNQYNRAPYADLFASEVGVRSVLNLSDSEEEMKNYLEESGHASPYYEQLILQNRVLALNLSSNYYKNSFAFTLAGGLRKMMTMDGPILIHCIEGKDRTGFVCLLLEGLAGASYEQVVADFMISFDNYLGITKESQPATYEYIKQQEVDSLIRHIALADEQTEPSQIDIHQASRQYLYNAGLTEEELNQLETYVRQ